MKMVPHVVLGKVSHNSATKRLCVVPIKRLLPILGKRHAVPIRKRPQSRRAVKDPAAKIALVARRGLLSLVVRRRVALVAKRMRFH